MDGAELIALERRRPIEIECFDDLHDSLHDGDQLLDAAVCYIEDSFVPQTPKTWPWERKWWKPSKDRVRNLVKAGALVAAEIDRLQRLKGDGR